MNQSQSASFPGRDHGNHAASAADETLWLPLAALPYYLLYARDLCRIGYPAADVLRVYALNLLLIPVNLAGVCNHTQVSEWERSKYLLAF